MATRDFKLLSIFSKPLAIPLMLFVLIVLIAFVLYFQLSLVQKLDLVSGLELKLKNISACDSVELQIDGTSKNVVASECVQKAFDSGVVQAAASMVSKSRDCKQVNVNVQGRQYKFVDAECVASMKQS